MTVLQALDRYYDRMAARNEAEAPGYSREKIGFAIVLSAEGEPIQILDLRGASGKRMVPRLLEVPAAAKRTAGILPNLFWDKTSYVLGRTAGEGKRPLRSTPRSRRQTLQCSMARPTKGWSRCAASLRRGRPRGFDMAPFIPEMLDANIVFRLDGELRYVHQRDAARRLIERAGRRSTARLASAWSAGSKRRCAGFTLDQRRGRRAVVGSVPGVVQPRRL